MGTEECSPWPTLSSATREYDHGMSASHGELDLGEARERLEKSAAEAKRLEASGPGHAAQAEWERYQLIADAIAAQERRARLAERASSG